MAAATGQRRRVPGDLQLHFPQDQTRTSPRSRALTDMAVDPRAAPAWMQTARRGPAPEPPKTTVKKEPAIDASSEEEAEAISVLDGAKVSRGEVTANLMSRLAPKKSAKAKKVMKRPTAKKAEKAKKAKKAPEAAPALKRPAAASRSKHEIKYLAPEDSGLPSWMTVRQVGQRPDKYFRASDNGPILRTMKEAMAAVAAKGGKAKKA